VTLLGWCLLVLGEDRIDACLERVQLGGRIQFASPVALRLSGSQRLANRLLGMIEPPGYRPNANAVPMSPTDFCIMLNP